MRRTQSDILRNNHHSLNRKQSPFSLQSSKADSLASMGKPRKMSAASLKQNYPDLEKLIMDIKISPSPDPSTVSIQQIYKSLKELESNHMILDQVHAISLLMQSIENKLSQSHRQKYRPILKTTLKKESICSQEKQISQVSPIKQISEQTSSRILYTNFSLKQVQKTLSQQNSLVESGKKPSAKVAISKFQQIENSEQVDKLNQQIKYLQRLLQSKTKGANQSIGLTLFKKKSCRY